MKNAIKLFVIMCLMFIPLSSFGDSNQYATHFRTIMISNGQSYSFDEDYSNERQISLPGELASWNCVRSAIETSFKNGQADKWNVNVVCNEVKDNKLLANEAEVSCDINKSSNKLDSFTLSEGKTKIKLILMCYTGKTSG